METLRLLHPDGSVKEKPPNSLTWWQCNALPERVEEQWASWDYLYRRAILDCLGSAKSIYEIGCGVGANLRLLQNQRPDLVLGGSDGSQDYCRIASQRLGVRIDEITLPGPTPAGWDIVLFNYVLSYLAPSDAQAVLRDIKAPRVIILEPTPSKKYPEGISVKGGIDHRNKFVCPQWCHPWPGWCFDLGWRPRYAIEIVGAGRLNLGMAYDTGYIPEATGYRPEGAGASNGAGDSPHPTVTAT